MCERTGGGYVDDTILLVDPYDDQRGMYSVALQHAGYFVIECADGQRAVPLAIDRHPAVVITEVASEDDGCGWQLIAMLRDDSRTASIPIICAGRRRIAAERGQAQARGATEHFAIPLGPSELIDAIRRLWHSCE